MKNTAQIIEDIAAHLLSGYPYLYILTWEEERADEILSQAAGKANRKLLAWSTTLSWNAEAAPNAPPENIVFAKFKELANHPAPSVFIFRDIHPYLDNKLIVRLLRDSVGVLNRNRHTFVFLAPRLNIPMELEKEVAIVDIPLPNAELLEKVFRNLQLEEKVLFPEEFIAKVVHAALGLTVREAERVFRRALLKGGGFKLDDVSLVIEEKKRLLKQSELLEFYEESETLASIGGLSELKKWLQSRESAFTEKARSFGLPAPKGLMLIGVQGCGKSLTAKAVANLWKFPLLRFDIGSAFAVYGQGEEHLRRAIKVSESLSPVILWIDEIEKAFAGVGEGQADRDTVRAFGTFITWLQEKREPVFVVATANDVTGLPPELMRKGRFDEIFFIDLPDLHEREEIFRIHLTRRLRKPQEFNIERLARMAEHYSGSEIEQAVISALHRAFSEEREVTEKDLELSLKETVPLYSTYEERIKWLRDWAKHRARFASRDVTILDYFENKGAEETSEGKSSGKSKKQR